MNRRLLLGAVAAVAALAVAVPVLAQQSRQAPQKGGDQAAIEDHKAQEARERDAAAERAKRREAARSGQDPREKSQSPQEEEEERAQR